MNAGCGEATALGKLKRVEKARQASVDCQEEERERQERSSTKRKANKEVAQEGRGVAKLRRDEQGKRRHRVRNVKWKEKRTQVKDGMRYGSNVIDRTDKRKELGKAGKQTLWVDDTLRNT